MLQSFDWTRSYIDIYQVVLQKLASSCDELWVWVWKASGAQSLPLHHRKLQSKERWVRWALETVWYETKSVAQYEASFPFLHMPEPVKECIPGRSTLCDSHFKHVSKVQWSTEEGHYAESAQQMWTCSKGRIPARSHGQLYYNCCSQNQFQQRLPTEL